MIKTALNAKTDGKQNKNIRTPILLHRHVSMEHDEKQQEVEVEVDAQAAASTYAVYTLINRFFVFPPLSRSLTLSMALTHMRTHAHTHSSHRRALLVRSLFWHVSIFMNRSMLVPVAPLPLPLDAIVIADVVAASSFSQFVSIHLSTYKKSKWPQWMWKARR